MTGWKCPGCGRCYAPFVAECGACKPQAVPASGSRPYPLYPWSPPGTAQPLPPLPENTCRV